MNHRNPWHGQKVPAKRRPCGVVVVVVVVVAVVVVAVVSLCRCVVESLSRCR